MRSASVRKRSMLIGGRSTSLNLEPGFWEGLNEIAVDQHMTVTALVGEIDKNRTQANLSSYVFTSCGTSRPRPQ
jgi:predicted DNA-binding ribbon-helix-helix protein